MSASEEERVVATLSFEPAQSRVYRRQGCFIEDIRNALFASKIVSSTAQGYTLMRAAAKTYGWNPQLRRNRAVCGAAAASSAASSLERSRNAFDKERRVTKPAA
jgi:6-phosphogluconate dehydrogenase